jgi:hypothetical protein
VAQDYQQALDLYHEAATDYGSQIAKYRIGMMYFEGQGVVKDYQEAERLFRRAALVRKGHYFWDDAMYCKLLAPNICLVMSWISVEEYRGYAVAHYALGQMYEEGIGMAQDYGRAVGRYRNAAEQGVASAQYSLGRMYEQGRGVEQDDQQATLWYRKAAEQGDVAAQNSLGRMYEKSLGGEIDFQQAAVWYLWYRKAAEQGDAEAQYNLGAMYNKGQGVPQDYQQAYAWSSVAAVSGHANAVKNRDIIASKLTQAQLVEAQALATQYFERSRPK